MTRSSKAAFSALAGLDPLERVPRTGRLASLRGPAMTSSDMLIARIIAVPRQGQGQISDNHAGSAPLQTGPPYRDRSRYGARGLVASAAIAVIATLLWVSPSAGAPSDQAVDTYARVDQMHSSTSTPSVARGVADQSSATTSEAAVFLR